MSLSRLPRLKKNLVRKRLRPVPWGDPVPGRAAYEMERSRTKLVTVCTLQVPFDIVTDNKLRWANWHTVKRYTDRVYEHMSGEALRIGLDSHPECPKAFSIVRITSFRKRAITDHGNLVGGCKAWLDALTWTHGDYGGIGVIADDSDTWSDVLYAQVTGPECLGWHGTVIDVWHLTWIRG